MCEKSLPSKCAVFFFFLDIAAKRHFEKENHFYFEIIKAFSRTLSHKPEIG